jgi:hypothetical protein
VKTDIKGRKLTNISSRNIKQLMVLRNFLKEMVMERFEGKVYEGNNELLHVMRYTDMKMIPLSKDFQKEKYYHEIVSFVVIKGEAVNIKIYKTKKISRTITVVEAVGVWE